LASSILTSAGGEDLSNDIQILKNAQKCSKICVKNCDYIYSMVKIGLLDDGNV